MTTIGLASEEMGRELKATELKARTVVVIQPPGAPFMITMWVTRVDIIKHTVTFYSASWKIVVTNRYDQNGVIYDDKGRTVHVYEYLGEV